MKRASHSTRSASGFIPAIYIAALALLAGPVSAAPAEPGRLFYTPAQRAQLEAVRVRKETSAPGKSGDVSGAAPATRYDGVVIRSDGTTTRWVDGKAQSGATPTRGLKPGQTRADGKVYEPYQILRQPTAPSQPSSEDAAP
jgi:hypothetical protein